MTYCDGCGAPATGRCPYCDAAGCDDCAPICDHDARHLTNAKAIAEADKPALSEGSVGE